MSETKPREAMKRDPAWNPAIGDVLSKGRETRTVTETIKRKDGEVWRLTTQNVQHPGKNSPFSEMKWEGRPTLTAWRAWAAKAEVVNLADWSQK